ncbi:UNVERIFIED_CONTAM: hypothetical protein Q9R58_12565 [Methylobacteriaceae bacterium AG10]|nr:hypothetical protein [Methylobacteriaceae bacterium AG10]
MILGRSTAMHRTGSDCPVRLAALEMIRALTHSALLQEALADKVMTAAADADDAGKGELARLYRAISRQRRVQALELQGRLADLNAQYAETYHPDR